MFSSRRAVIINLLVLFLCVGFGGGRECFSQEGDISIGSSLPLTGEMGVIGKQYLHGAASYIEYVNDKGGIGGRKIKIIALDDSYNPRQCAVNTLNLIKKERVFALFCYGGSSTTMYALPVISSNRVPLVGILSGVTPLREPFNPYVVNIRAPLSKEIDEMVKRSMDLGIKKIAVFYQFDVLGSDGVNAVEEAVFKYSDYILRPVAEENYQRNSPDITKGVKSIKNSGAEAVLLVGTYKPLVAFIKECVAQGYRPLFLTTSNIGVEVFAEELGDIENTAVVVSQVVPPLGEDLPAVKNYKEFLKRRFPDDVPTSIGLEGFINARVLVEAMERSGAKSRDGLVSAIEMMRDFDVGIDQKVSFGNRDHQGLEDVYFLKIVNGKVTPLGDWDNLKKFVP